MSDPQPASDSADARQNQESSALFAQLVLQQSNMALMLLGKVAHPETGKTVRDLEAARLFIDQLEMLESKTRGNLNKEESNLLKQSLMTLRLAFVEAADEPVSTAQPRVESPAQDKAPAPAAETSGATEGGAGTAASDDEHRKKFSKKY